MEQELKSAIQTDLTKLGTENYEVIVSCGKYFNALAMKGTEMPADKRISISGNLTAEDLIAFAQHLASTTYVEKHNKMMEDINNGFSTGVMSDGVGNAFIYDGDLHELLCGVEVNFEGKEISSEIHSTTLEPHLGKPVDFSSMHR